MQAERIHNDPSETKKTDATLLEENPDFYWDDGRA